LRPITKKIFTILVIFLAVRLAARYVLPLCFPFLLGAGLALIAEPAVNFFSGRLRMPRAAAAGIGVTAAFGAISLVLLMVFALLLREVKYLTTVLPDLEETARSGILLLQSWLLAGAAQLPQSIGYLLQQNITEFFSGGTALLDRGIRYILGLAGNLLTHVPDSALALGTAVISGYMISAKLPKLRQWLRNHLPLQKLKPLLETLKRVRTALGGWLLAQLKLSGVTLLLLAGGFLLLRIPNGLLWSLAVCLLDALPVLGTGAVLLPWSLICFLQSNTPRAIGLLGLYATITLLRSMLEPKLVGRQLGLDPLATLISLYAGYKLWGIGGMILAPMLTVTALQLLPEQNTNL
jgi:sporulation integral membrane protein YtvI